MNDRWERDRLVLGEPVCGLKRCSSGEYRLFCSAVTPLDPVPDFANRFSTMAGQCPLTPMEDIVSSHCSRCLINLLINCIDEHPCVELMRLLAVSS
jgi:hypothetical protein